MSSDRDRGRAFDVQDQWRCLVASHEACDLETAPRSALDGIMRAGEDAF